MNFFDFSKILNQQDCFENRIIKCHGKIFVKQDQRGGRWTKLQQKCLLIGGLTFAGELGGVWGSGYGAQGRGIDRLPHDAHRGLVGNPAEVIFSKLLSKLLFPLLKLSRGS